MCTLIYVFLMHLHLLLLITMITMLQLTPHKMAATTEGRTSTSTCSQPHEPLLVGWIMGASCKWQGTWTWTMPRATPMPTPAPVLMTTTGTMTEDNSEFFSPFYSIFMSSLVSHCLQGGLPFCLFSRHHAPSSLEMQDGGGHFLLFSTNKPLASWVHSQGGFCLFFCSLFFIVL